LRFVLQVPFQEWKGPVYDELHYLFLDEEVIVQIPIQIHHIKIGELLNVTICNKILN